MKRPIEYLYQGLDINPRGIAATDQREQVSYSELVTRVEALAQALRQRLPDGAHVALCAQNHIDHLVAHLAIIAANQVWVPINPKNGQQLNSQLIEVSQPQLILVDRASLDSLPETLTETRSPVVSIDTPNEGTRQWIEQFRGRAFTLELPSFDRTMAIKFTGGTTGQPKGVIQTHGNVSAVVANMQAQFDFTRDDVNLAVAPLTHGGSHYILPILGAGGSHCLLTTPDIAKIAQALPHSSVSFMPPTLIYKLLEYPGLDRDSAPRLRHLTYSAAPMPPQKISEVITRFGPCLSTVYGQTEAPMTITAMSAQDMQNPALQRSVGRPCLHSELCILRPDGAALPAGETGEVAVRGAIVMPGYFGSPEQSAGVFKDGWLLTGDLGYVDSDGYLFLQGRSKELIISGGFNVYPAEVENAMIKLPDVRECAVFGVADEYWGERVEAAVCLVDGSTANSDTLRAQLKPLLGDVKTPKRIHLLSALPRNPVGKVVRREVKALCRSHENPIEHNAEARSR